MSFSWWQYKLRIIRGVVQLGGSNTQGDAENTDNIGMIEINDINIQLKAGGSETGDGGSIAIESGSSSSTNTGSVSIGSKASESGAVTGIVTLQSGDSTSSNTGEITIRSGTTLMLDKLDRSILYLDIVVQAMMAGMILSMVVVQNSQVTKLVLYSFVEDQIHKVMQKILITLV